MQQKYRDALTSGPTHLKRSEIGEIASRIGHLYYLYYLRTSDISYLNQSFTFYKAIHTRGYFKWDDVSKDVTASSSSNGSSGERQQLASRTLRYYARYLVVCLLLGLGDDVTEPIVTDMALALVRYKTECGPTAAAESAQWLAFLDDAKAFLAARAPISLRDPATGNKTRSIESGRLKTLSKETLRAYAADPADPAQPHSHQHQQQQRLRVQTAILAAGRRGQAKKAGELMLDTLRMAHSLELGLACQKRCPLLHNPAKYMLFSPTAQQVILHLACATEALRKTVSDNNNNNNNINNNALFLYVAGNGNGEGGSGVSMRNSVCGGDSDNMIEALRPEDIVPYMRWPFFVVVDAEDAEGFGTVENPYDAPFLCLVAPKSWEAAAVAAEAEPGLFTLFLHQPLAAFCVLCGLFNPSKLAYAQCASALAEYFDHVVALLESLSRKIK